MPELKPEIIGLLIGLSFSIAVFAFKTAVGEFYFLTREFPAEREISFPFRVHAHLRNSFRRGICGQFPVAGKITVSDSES